MQHEPDPPPALPAQGPREFVHRLNNYLTVVLAYAETSLGTDDQDEMRRALEIILEASNSMADAARGFAKSSRPAELASHALRHHEGS